MNSIPRSFMVARIVSSFAVSMPIKDPPRSISGSYHEGRRCVARRQAAIPAAGAMTKHAGTTL
jgi:hypothetical protein